MSQNKLDLLVVEDDAGLQKQLKWALDDYNVLMATNHQEAIIELRRFQPSVVTLDLGLPPDPANASVGLSLLQEILQLSPTTKVIVVTGNDQREVALKAVEFGAYDFYQKPIQTDELSLIVKRAFELSKLEADNRNLFKQQTDSFHGIVATSPEMMQVCQHIEKVAPTDAGVMLVGESGTGKELLARVIHNMSSRSNQHFISINCAAISDNLLDVELFGNVLNTTDSPQVSIGKIEQANGGTLFLSEIGEMPLSLQAKLLGFLRARQIEKQGKLIPIDVRIIVAAEDSLEDKVAQSQFREDLFYNLNEIKLKIPSLAQRNGDVVLIARTLLEKYSEQYGRSFRGFSSDAVRAMESYSWPGNIKELENKIKSAVVMSDAAQISANDLQINQEQLNEMPLNLRQVRAIAESRAIQRAIVLSGSNISKTAKLLGVTRPTLYNLMDKYGIKY